MPSSFWIIRHSINSYFRRLVKNGNRPIYLVMCESPAVRPDNWIISNHAPFRKVFTWSPALVDGRKYFRMRMPFKLPDFAAYEASQADKFCCLIASQKYSWVSQELYTERVRAIRWFEKNHPGEFDLYGQRWDRFFFQKKLSIVNPVLNLIYRKFPWLPRRQRFPSARGSVAIKRDILRQYKFSICYENASYPGWITEKILDPMFAGCVPIYQGDPEWPNSFPKKLSLTSDNLPITSLSIAILKTCRQPSTRPCAKPSTICSWRSDQSHGA